MEKITTLWKLAAAWIQQHQIVAFFLITFTISFGLGFSLIAMIQRDAFFLAPLASIALCGPALAGIIVTAIGSRERETGQNRRRWILFFSALIGCSAVFATHNSLLNHAPFSPLMIILAPGLIVPPVAYLISAVYSRNLAVRRSLSTFIDFRRAGVYSLIALLFVPGLALLSILISNLLGKGSPNAGGNVLGAPLLGLIAVKFLYQFFFFNATGEELGWSGFARPHLQARLSPLVTALVVTLFWAPWHLFLWYAEGRELFTWNFWLETYVNLVPAAIIIGWLYNRSRGSILVAGIGHAAANTVFAFLPHMNWDIYNAIVLTAACLLIVVDRMWQKLPRDHPALIQKVEPGSPKTAELNKAVVQ